MKKLFAYLLYYIGHYAYCLDAIGLRTYSLYQRAMHWSVIVQGSSDEGPWGSVIDE